MAIWPASLPSEPLYTGFRETAPNTVLRTNMSAGPPKLRRRFTAGFRPISIEMVMTDAQVQAIDDFYITILFGGSLPFDFTDPRTDVSESYQFKVPPQYRPIAPDNWTVSIELEMLP